jgi:hypothetical protein
LLVGAVCSILEACYSIYWGTEDLVDDLGLTQRKV